MTLRRLPAVALAALLIGAAPPAAPAADTQAAQRIRAHVDFLASDLLEGRDTGSRGHEIAAAYVASQFSALGLRPGGEKGGWFQRVPLRRATNVGAPKLSLSWRGRSTALIIGRDALVQPSVTQRQRSITAPLVFVGRGISDARLGIDDYAGLDVRGKIAVALSSPPPGLQSEVAAHLNSAQTATAAAHGAIGFVALDEPTAAQVQQTAGRAALDWVDRQGRTGRPGSALTQIALSHAASEQLFHGARMDLRAIRAAAATGRRIRGFELPARLSLSARSEWQELTSPQVIAVLPGADPKLAPEHIVLMAHLDHLGKDGSARPGTDAIYNGALDNAAGVATMIEAARAFVRSGKPPRRSVMFIANTGEEPGLLGASYFAAHPTVAAERIAALVDLDMPLLLYDFTDVIAFGAERSTIARAVSRAGAGIGVAVSPDPMPAETLFVRSDHYAFVKRGVPAVFLMTGWANGGRQHWQRFLAQTYHTVKDDLAQPIRWNAGARFAELNYRIARTLADADQPPMWYAGDYFGETFAPGRPKARR